MEGRRDKFEAYLKKVLTALSEHKPNPIPMSDDLCAFLGFNGKGRIYVSSPGASFLRQRILSSTSSDTSPSADIASRGFESPQRLTKRRKSGNAKSSSSHSTTKSLESTTHQVLRKNSSKPNESTITEGLHDALKAPEEHFSNGKKETSTAVQEPSIRAETLGRERDTSSPARLESPPKIARMDVDQNLMVVPTNLHSMFDSILNDEKGESSPDRTDTPEAQKATSSGTLKSSSISAQGSDRKKSIINEGAVDPSTTLTSTHEEGNRVVTAPDCTRPSVAQRAIRNSFQRAAHHLQTSKIMLRPKVKLKIYALYKQATKGPCSSPKPSAWNVKGRMKWDAWNKLGPLSREDAMIAYAEEISGIFPDRDFWSGTVPQLEDLDEADDDGNGVEDDSDSEVDDGSNEINVHTSESQIDVQREQRCNTETLKTHDVREDMKMRFSAASASIRTHLKSFPKHVRLALYSLYKQATCGACTVPKPSALMVGKSLKWKAWSELGDMSKESAMIQYIHQVEQLHKSATFPTSSPPSPPQQTSSDHADPSVPLMNEDVSRRVISNKDVASESIQNKDNDSEITKKSTQEMQLTHGSSRTPPSPIVSSATTATLQASSERCGEPLDEVQGPSCDTVSYNKKTQIAKREEHFSHSQLSRKRETLPVSVVGTTSKETMHSSKQSVAQQQCQQRLEKATMVENENAIQVNEQQGTLKQPDELREGPVKDKDQSPTLSNESNGENKSKCKKENRTDTNNEHAQNKKPSQSKIEEQKDEKYLLEEPQQQVIEPQTGLQTLFDVAVSRVDTSGKSISLSTEQQLRLYGLFKHVTKGCCRQPQPSSWRVQKFHKWKAWNALGKMSKEEAMRHYVDLVDAVMGPVTLAMTSSASSSTKAHDDIDHTKEDVIQKSTSSTEATGPTPSTASSSSTIDSVRPSSQRYENIESKQCLCSDRSQVSMNRCRTMTVLVMRTNGSDEKPPTHH